MKIQYLNGGLANQVFQYIFMRYAELSNPGAEPWFLDDSFFYINQVHNGLELEKVFGLKLNLLSRAFEEDVWNEMIENKKKGISVPQSFLNLGFPMMMITEFDNYKEHNPFDGEIIKVPGNAYIPEIAKLKRDYVYYHGYWLHGAWLNEYKDIIKKELAFPSIEDAKNKAYQKQIKQTQSIAIHIRRGDYVQIGWTSSDDFYYNANKEMTEKHPDASAFIFSDDLEWCKQNCEALGLSFYKNVIFVAGNVRGKNYIDLQLMSMCRYMIMGKSAFAYLAMLLNDNLLDYKADQ